MKKVTIVSIIMMIISFVLINTANADFAVGMNMEANKKTISIGDEEILTLNFNEKIVACNFNIVYDSNVFTLIGSNTTNLNVAEKDGKIACIYADMSGSGTNKIGIKFKANKETSGSKFMIENAKFRAEGQEKSYTGTQISGIDKVLEVSVSKEVNSSKNETENIVDEEEKNIVGNIIGSDEGNTDNNIVISNQIKGKDTTVVASNSLPKAGNENGYILFGASVILLIASVIFGKKAKELDKIFSSISVVVIALILTTSISTKTYAASEITFRVNDNLLESKKVLGIMFDNSSETEKQITKRQLVEKKTNITSVKDKRGTEVGENDFIKTGDVVISGDGEYYVVLYGDANGDGIICDTDDIMVILRDYLGIENATDEYRLASNLNNADSVLDTDDLMQMINMYLGNLNTDLVVNLPADSVAISNDIKISYNNTTIDSWEYNNSNAEINPPKLGTEGSTSYEGYFGTDLAFSTDTNYQIQYEYVNNLTEVFATSDGTLNGQCGEYYNNLNDIELNSWKFKNSGTDKSVSISFQFKWVCNNQLGSRTLNKPFIKMRLYDSSTGKYSDDKTITVRQFFEGMGYTVVPN